MYIDKSYILNFIAETDLNHLIEYDPDNPGPSNARLEKAILRAQAKMDFYIAKRVVVPLPETDVPEDLKGVCVDLTIYYLHSKTQSNDFPEMVRIKFEDAIATLKDIAKGIGEFQFKEDPKPEEETTIITVGDEPVMTRGMM